MPHDKHGREIQVGDFVKAKPYNYSKVPVVGRVVEMRTGQTCSGEFAWLSPWDGVRKDAFGADESELIVKADGSDPAPVAIPEQPPQPIEAAPADVAPAAPAEPAAPAQA
jgi:hypothetical protein